MPVNGDRSTSGCPRRATYKSYPKRGCADRTELFGKVPLLFAKVSRASPANYLQSRGFRDLCEKYGEGGRTLR
jgi:hypothetical protein